MQYCGALQAEEHNDSDQADACPTPKRRKLCNEESSKDLSDGTDSGRLSVEDSGDTNGGSVVIALPYLWPSARISACLIGLTFASDRCKQGTRGYHQIS